MKFLKIGGCKTDISPPVGYLLCGHLPRNKPSKKNSRPIIFEMCFCFR
ncbi:MAG TPA: hypothetical protein PKV21_08835 [bacterium]|nr:hypothetical protein [bacterium]HOM27590.1 hypothetical protein [bacterium]